TLLPDGPKRLLGLVNLGGTVLPVVNMRSRLAIPDKPIELDDRLVRLGGTMAFCFFVDRVVGVSRFAEEAALDPKKIYPQLEQYLSGVGKYAGEIVLFMKMAALFPGIAEETRSLLDERGIDSRAHDE
ncbi:MAG: chemotaxis protein CheW, partial [Magnetococcales bacterium]|nr:chemotaxis protein CheW [Magnetococcales bacterium]